MERIVKYKENGKVDYQASVLEILTETADNTTGTIAGRMFHGTIEHGKASYVGEVLSNMVKDGTLIKTGREFDIAPKEEGSSIRYHDQSNGPVFHGNEEVDEEEVDEAPNFPNSKIEKDIDVKHDTVTGEIDFVDTIIALVTMNPGVTRKAMTTWLFSPSTRVDDRDRFDVVLDIISENGSEEQALLKAEGLYFLYADGMRHDMEITEQTMNTLRDEGISYEQANFLVSGVVMAAERAIAESEGHEYNVMQTAAASPGAVYNPDAGAEVEKEEDNTVVNPFKDLSEEESEEMKETIAREHKAEAAAEMKKAYTDKIKNITSATQLLGEKVEISDKFDGQVIATILELRATGLTFLVTFSTDETVTEGTILPFEYSDGVTYKLLAD